MECHWVYQLYSRAGPSAKESLANTTGIFKVFFVDLLIHFAYFGILWFISFCFVCFDFHLGEVVFYPFFLRERKNMKLGGYGVGRDLEGVGGRKEWDLWSCDSMDSRASWVSIHIRQEGNLVQCNSVAVFSYFRLLESIPRNFILVIFKCNTILEKNFLLITQSHMHNKA